MSERLRIACIMGGGVSLGTFSAGALGEVLRLVDAHLDREKYPGGCEVDVLCGASAGSMTLVGALLALETGRDPLEVLQAVWVDGIDVRGGRVAMQDVPGLVPADAREHGEPSLLSAEPLHWLAEWLLGGEERAIGQAPTALLGDEVLVSVALSNLNGIHYRAHGQILSQASRDSLPLGAARDAVETAFFADRRRFRLVRAGDVPEGGDVIAGSSRDRSFWNLLMEAAIASGLFPVAFPPRAIERQQREYGSFWPHARRQRHAFLYADGGLFNNEPLREALDLANGRDEGQEVRRLFLFIDPNLSGSAADPRFWFVEEEEDRRGVEGLLRLVLRLGAVIQGEAQARDWLRAARTNARLEWSGQVVRYLAAVVGALDVEAFRRICRQQGWPDPAETLENVYADKVRRTPGGEHLSAEEIASRARVQRQQHRRRAEALYGGLLDFGGETRRDLFLTFAMLFEVTAGFRRKRRVDMLAITPATLKDSELCGNFMANFGGFLDQGWRQHDFDVGRAAARRALVECDPALRVLGGGVPELPAPARRDPDPVYARVQKEQRRHFERYAHNYLERALGKWLPDWVDHWVASRLMKFLRRKYLYRL